MSILIKGGTVYQNHRFTKADVRIADGIIKDIGSRLLSEDSVVYEAKGNYVVPGFIDVHTHGAVNIDVNSATAEDLELICRYVASQGTTGWLCSVLTDTKEQTLWCIQQYNQWKQMEHKGAQLLGIHLEGPFLAPEYKGAMPEHLLQKSNIALVEEYQKAAGGDIRYMTVSPEAEGVLEAIPELKRLGIQVAIGHSGADYETARQAIKNGAMSATHVGNAMKLLHQHFPSIFGAVLEDDQVYCEVICDGRHLHPGTVRLILKTKGLDRVVAITDSIMATGLPDGNYKLGVNDIVVVDGDAKLAENGVRAGSTLTMVTAFQNLLSFTERVPEEILPLLTENPARLLEVFEKYGSIEEGKAASLVILNQAYQVVDTFAQGRLCKI